jgi:general stress protein YciG
MAFLFNHRSEQQGVDVMTAEKGKGGSERGFAAMDEDKQREIARKGGQSVPPEERSFSKDPELASQAGRKGGQSVRPEERSFSKDPELASQAGRKGGEVSGARRSSEDHHRRGGR